jgi:cytochrome c oxidase subunit 3
MNKVLIIGKGKRFEFLLSLVGTIVFGLMFMMVQAVEYTSFSANFNDSVFGSCFYMLTGFHGFHVILGLVFLNVCLWLHYKRIFLNTVHVFAELAIVYWHFVDIIWIGLFFIVYC